MYRPTSAQVLTVIDNFKKVLPLAVQPDHLDMWVTGVNMNGHACGTVHCHGGWYAVATLPHNKGLGYLDGAQKMATDLGFNNSLGLKDWAYNDIDIWGNTIGGEMFCNKKAFASDTRPNGAENLQHIIDHWTEVYNRIKQTEV